MLVLGLIRASSLVLVASGRAKSFCAAANALASSVRVRPKFETCAKPCAVQQSLSAAAVAFFSSVGGFANYMSNLDRVHLGFVTVRHYQSSVYVRDTPRGGERRWWMAGAGGTLSVSRPHEQTNKANRNVLGMFDVRSYRFRTK